MKKVSPLSFSLPMFICLCIIGCTNKSNSEKITSQDSFTKEKDLVPNRNTALEIAKAIWVPIYGEEVLSKLPFNVKLKDSSIWIVTGTLPKGMKGGIPYIEISMSDCSILKVGHGK